MWCTFHSSHIFHIMWAMGGLQLARNELIVAASGALSCMLKFKFTVNMLICKESTSCCPLIPTLHYITLHYITLHYLISSLDVLCLHSAFSEN